MRFSFYKRVYRFLPSVSASFAVSAIFVVSAIGITTLSNCVTIISGVASPFNSATMRSRICSKAAIFSFLMGSAGSCGTFRGSMFVPFFQMR